MSTELDARRVFEYAHSRFESIHGFPTTREVVGQARENEATTMDTIRTSWQWCWRWSKDHRRLDVSATRIAI